MGKESMKLFMPIIASNLTAAVYTCQMMNPEMKNNPENAIRHVILTWERVGEFLTAGDREPLQVLQRVTQHLANEISNVQKRLDELKVIDPQSLSPEQLSELQALPMKAQALSEMAALLRGSAQ